jgi:hypothetical protein
MTVSGIINAHCIATTPETDDGAFFDRVDVLGGTLEAAGVGQAWVTSDRARGFQPEKSDEVLVEACLQRSLLLRPLLTFVPSRREHDPLRRLRAGSARYACRAVRLCPGKLGHRYPLVDWVVSPIPESCEREGATIVLDYSGVAETVPWVEVVGFARAFPRIAMILVGLDSRDAALEAALDVTANLIIQIPATTDVTSLVELVRRIGNHRFVYGSGGAFREAEAAVLRDGWELLDEHDRRAILGENAAALESGAWQETYL